jgi:hypothetical protein
MATSIRNENVPMSVKMERVLAKVKRMSPEERVQLMIKAGLMTEAEAPDALEHIYQSMKKKRSKSKPHQAK